MEEHDFFKTIKQIELVASRLVDSFLSGTYRSVFKGQGIELGDVREYEAGDDVRLIDWNVTSRMGTPYTKVFREEREIILFLVVDCSASIFTGIGKKRKSELCALLFALLGISSAINNDRTGCVFFSDKIERWVPPRSGKRHVLRIIADLFKISPSGKGSELRLALLAVGKFLKRRSVCVIISDFKTSGFLHELSIVSRKHDCIAIRIEDDSDMVFPVTGTVELEDPETGAILLAAGGAGSFRNAYERYWSASWAATSRELERRNVETIDIRVSDDPALKLMEFFERRKRRWRLY
jgi:uncharacterized protein (DUF58 family)